MALLTLGDVQLNGFEVPASVKFGGSQRAAVHKLLGGGRVIDAMGRDDSALAWSGILSGNEASDRARTLDAMRAGAMTLPLSWNVFCYSVIISRLDLEFHNPWWIRYQIECTVLADLARPEPVYEVLAVDSIIADLNVAATFMDVGGALSSVSAPGALMAGSTGISVAIGDVAAVQSTIAIGVASSEVGLDATDIPTVVSAAGNLAQLCCARGYVDRSLVNVQGILA